MVIPQWMKKSLVILLSIMTLGLVSPDDFHWQDEASANSKPNKKSSFEETKPVDEYVIATDILEEKDPFNREQQLESFLTKAEENCYLKFGDRIKPRIEDEFKDIVLPKMEEAIAQYLDGYEEDELINLAISEKPTSSATGEKIFNIYDQQTSEDIIRFHVRRENPPQQGYWFNFHYHTRDDQFQAHHNLGSIYWDKNTPPAWNQNIQ